MSWPLDKLAVIQTALGLCGDNIPPTEEDGSPEWLVGSLAYESAITYMMENGNWNFGNGVEPLNRIGDSPDAIYTDAYAKPASSLHLIWVRVNDFQVNYKIIGNRVCLNAGVGAVTAGFVAQPTMDQVTPTFAKALECFVRAGIYGGLHEDTAAEQSWWAMGERFLGIAKTRADQEGSKRSFFNSRLRMARIIRRPWPSSPQGWGRG
jgi:hypothetical protein